MSDLSEHLKSFLKFLVFIILFSGLTYITYHSIINSRNQVRAAHYYPIKPELPKLDTGPPIPILVDPGADIYKTGVTRLHYAVRDATELIRGSHINAIVISNDLSQYGGNMDNNHLYFWKGDLYLPDYMTKFDFDMVFPYMIHEVVHSATTNDLKSSYALINKEWWIPDFIATGMNNGPPAGGFHQSIEEDMAIAASKYAVKADADKLKAEKPKVYDWLKKYIFQGKEVNEHGTFSKSYINLATLIQKGTDIFKLIINKIYASDVTNQIVDPHRFDFIIPGQTTRQEIMNKLGESWKSEMSTDRMFYLAGDFLHYHTIILKDGTVYLATIHYGSDSKETIDKTIPEDLKVYNSYSETSMTYIYGQVGLAITADFDGKILVKQKFIPKPAEEFVSEWKENLSHTSFFSQGSDDLKLVPTVDPVAPIEYRIFAITFLEDYKKSGAPSFSVADIDGNGVVNIFDYNRYVQKVR